MRVDWRRFLSVYFALKTPGSAGFLESRTGDINGRRLVFPLQDLLLSPGSKMHKQQLIEIFRKILDTEEPFEFLLKLTESELETLIAGVRGRIDPGE